MPLSNSFLKIMCHGGVRRDLSKRIFSKVGNDAATDDKMEWTPVSIS